MILHLTLLFSTYLKMKERTKPIKVMLVDDAVFMRKILADLLLKNDYELVGEASNGLMALQKYPLLKPDVVLMDITMPDMDGIQAVKEIKKIDKDAQVIMVSAMGQKPMVMEALANGAVDFIVKPFQTDVVLKALHKVEDRLSKK